MFSSRVAVTRANEICPYCMTKLKYCNDSAGGDTVFMTCPKCNQYFTRLGSHVNARIAILRRRLQKNQTFRLLNTPHSEMTEEAEYLCLILAQLGILGIIMTIAAALGRL